MNVFENIKNPKVLSEIDVYTFLDHIENPETEILDKINKARSFYDSEKSEYQNIKASLPCFTLNFSFTQTKSNSTIKLPTGFIYLDIDKSTEINLENPLIFASWKSLSNNGRGILVKVNNLSLENFKTTYVELANKLNIKADIHAAKATQYCIHSYDKDLYYNDDSTTWEATKVQFKNPPLRGYPYKKVNPKMGVKKELRFSNIDEYYFNDKDYLYFEDEKELIAQVNVPRKINKGGRNSILYAIAYQIKALNSDISYESLSKLVYFINLKRCFPMLGRNEVENILHKVHSMEEIKPEINKEKRFLFNPSKGLTFNEKMNIINPILGERRSKKTIDDLKKYIEQWDVKTHGKLTQKSLQKLSGKNIKTVEKYYKLFKKEISEINQRLKPIQVI
ncbi:MAG: hypothetical protein JXQ93_04875 [Flavobacteriaceae bacterium]